MNEAIKCPKCNSTQIYIDKRGFKTGRAIAGGLLTGNILVAAAAGGIGHDKIEMTCLKCGCKFKIGEGAEITPRSIPQPQKIKGSEGRVIRPEEAEKTQMYRCDCGKECCLPINLPICPKCGRRLNDDHKFTPEDKGSGCAPVILCLIISLIFTYCVVVC